MYQTMKAHKYSLFTFIIISILSFILFYKHITVDNRLVTLLVSVSLTYALFTSATLRLIENRYIKIREYLGTLNAKIQEIYNISKHCNKEFVVAIKKALDSYIVTEIESNIHGYDKTQVASYELYDALKKYKIENKKQELIFSRIINALYAFSDNREMVELYSQKILTGPLKMLYNALTFMTLTIFILAILTLNNIYSFVFIAYLFFFIYFTYYIKDVDDLNIGKIAIKHHNRKQIFDLLGILPFCANQRYFKYNVYHLKKGEKCRFRNEKGKIIEKIY